MLCAPGPFHLLILLTATMPYSAFAGPGGTGGGNWQEADFTSVSRSTAEDLKSNRDEAESSLGIRLDAYVNALDSTPVQCATDGVLQKMRLLDKQAYYEATLNGIFLDCEKYDKIPKDKNVRRTLFFHEYMRKVVHEDSEYGVSSRLVATLQRIQGPAAASASTASSVPKCWFTRHDSVFGNTVLVHMGDAQRVEKHDGSTLFDFLSSVDGKGCSVDWADALDQYHYLRTGIGISLTDGMELKFRERANARSRRLDLDTYAILEKRGTGFDKACFNRSIREKTQWTREQKALQSDLQRLQSLPGLGKQVESRLAVVNESIDENNIVFYTGVYYKPEQELPRLREKIAAKGLGTFLDEELRAAAVVAVDSSNGCANGLPTVDSVADVIRQHLKGAHAASPEQSVPGESTAADAR